MMNAKKQYKVEAFTTFKTWESWYYPFTQEGYQKATNKMAELIVKLPSYVNITIVTIES